MSPLNDYLTLETRRQFFGRSAMGLGKAHRPFGKAAAFDVLVQDDDHAGVSLIPRNCRHRRQDRFGIAFERLDEIETVEDQQSGDARRLVVLLGLLKDLLDVGIGERRVLAAEGSVGGGEQTIPAREYESRQQKQDESGHRTPRSRRDTERASVLRRRGSREE